MEIRIEPHTLKRATERGASKTEIISCLKSGQILPARMGDLLKKWYLFSILNGMTNFMNTRS